MNANDPMTREETAASLSGGAKTDALRALRVLAETAETPAPEDTTETPPLPAPLRELWQETYGEDAVAGPVPVASREGWLRRMARFFTTPRAAWAGGLAAAAAAIAVIVYHQDPAAGRGGGITTRGTSHGTGETSAARLIVVAAADKAEPLLKELTHAFPSRRIERVDSAPSGGAGEAIVIDTAARQISRTGQPGATELSGDPLANPESVIIAIEALDEPEPR
jgi:hypothetical protein